MVLGRSAARSPRFEILADLVRADAASPLWGAGSYGGGRPARRPWRGLGGLAAGAAGALHGLAAVYAGCPLEGAGAGAVREVGTDRNDMSGVLHVWPLLLAVAAWLYGRVDRVVERARFRVTMARHGYANHGQYIKGPHWGARRPGSAGPWWLSAVLVLCDCRGRVFMIHHLDYSRAGAGVERDRDLRSVCERCHTRFHRWDRPRGLLRACGVTLRWTTFLV